MRRVLLFLALACLAFAPAPLPPRPQREAPAPASLAGAWQGARWVLITDTHIAFTFHRAWGPCYKLTLHPGQKPPAFDLSLEGYEGPRFLGVYRVRGDVLTLCYNPADKGRPTSFDGPGKGEVTEVFERKR